MFKFCLINFRFWLYAGVQCCTIYFLNDLNIFNKFIEIKLFRNDIPSYKYKFDLKIKIRIY